MDKRTFSFIFLGIFIFATWYFYDNNDSIAQIISHNGIEGIFWYFISNFSYILILISIFLLNREAGLMKNIVGGIMVIIAFDIVAFPRFSPTELSNDIMFLASSDGIIVHKLLSFGLTYKTVYFIYYLVFPIALVLGSLSILGITDFFKRLTGGRSA